jgi:23S rRNA (uracil1939-C5)-methyltransferase
LDPPRSGAPTEIWSGLRDSSIQRIVYLACDPKTLVSTSTALSDQGFNLTHLVPVDQFPRTAHWELIARFDRGGESLPGSPN